MFTILNTYLIFFNQLLFIFFFSSASLQLLRSQLDSASTTLIHFLTIFNFLYWLVIWSGAVTVYNADFQPSIFNISFEILRFLIRHSVLSVYFSLQIHIICNVRNSMYKMRLHWKKFCSPFLLVTKFNLIL